MKFNILQKFVFVLFFGISLTGCYYKKGILAADWYLSPEDGGPKSYENPTPIDSTLTRTVDDLLDANLTSLVRIDKMPVPTPPPGRRLGDEMTWRLGAFVGDLSISSSGVLGNLIWGGSPGVQMVWEKSSVELSHEELMRILQGVPSIQFNRNMSRDDQRRQIESAMKSALTSGWVRDEAALRKTLLSSMDRLQFVGSVLDRLPSRGAWRVAAFRQVIAVDALGNISSSNSVGTQMSFKFEWIRKEASTLAPYTLAQEEESKLPIRLKQNLIEFVNSVSEDIQEVSIVARSYQETGYDPSSVHLGLAVTSEGDIGVAKGGVELWGRIVLEPIKNADVSDVSNISKQDGYFPVIASEANSDWIRFSEKEKIPFRRVIEKSGQSNAVVYKMDRRKIRKGFRRSAKLGEFFVRRAEFSKKGDWGVQYLSLKLNVSLSGMTTLTPVTQDGEMDLNFKKRINVGE